MRALLSILLLASILAPFAHAGGGAYGVAPTDVPFGQVIRQETIYRTLSVQNGKDEQVRVEIVALDEPGSWALPSEENLTIPARSALDVPLRAVIPADIPDGRYVGALHVRFVPNASIATGTSGASIALAVRVNLTFDVGGEQILKLQAGGLHVPDIEEGGSPILHWQVRNAGNVRATPTALITIERPDGTFVARENATGSLLRPGVVQNVSFHLTTSLPRGQYVAIAQLAKPGDETTEKTWFDVLEPGSLRRSATLGPLAFTDEGTRMQTNRIPFGNSVELGGNFTNTGQLPVKASLRGSIALDGKRLSDLNSSEVLVDPGETVRLRIHLPTLPRAGQYVVTAEAHYSGKVTPSQDVYLVYEASAPGEERAPGPALPLVIAAVGVGAAVYAAAATRRNQRRK